MTTHLHDPKDEAVVRRNWEATEVVADRFLDMMRGFRDESCAPWCVSIEFQELMLSYSSLELTALLHVMLVRLLNREEIDRGLDAPTPPW